MMRSNFTSKLVLALLLQCLVLFYSQNLQATSKTPANATAVEDNYKAAISHINQSLIDNQTTFESSPQSLANFVDDSLLPLWNSTKTLRGLLGKSNWQALTEDEKQTLTKAFNDTIQRYVQEGFSLYDGQKLEFVSVKFNKKHTRGLLTVKVIPNLMPEFNVNFKIAKAEQNWHLYDVLVQGVSYISLKKDSFRNTYKNQGVNAIIEQVKAKNTGYVASQRELASAE